MEWLEFIDETDQAVVEFATWLMTLIPAARKDLVGRIDELKNLAARGEIVLPEDESERGELDAIRRNPDLYELRWTLYTKVVRQYHAEPARLPENLVSLLIHIKTDTAHPGVPQPHGDQDVEISKALLRYSAGEKSDWGAGH